MREMLARLTVKSWPGIREIRNLASGYKKALT